LDAKVAFFQTRTILDAPGFKKDGTAIRQARQRRTGSQLAQNGALSTQESGAFRLNRRA
jgi:hypothetical protein